MTKIWVVIDNDAACGDRDCCGRRKYWFTAWSSKERATAYAKKFGSGDIEEIILDTGKHIDL